MDFRIPDELRRELDRFNTFLNTLLKPNLAVLDKARIVPKRFFQDLGCEGWLGFDESDGRICEQPALKQALLMEVLAKLSPGLAVAALVQMSLGLKGLYLFGSRALKREFLHPGIRGDLLACLGATESVAGSDVAGISTEAEEVAGGFRISGAKAYVTSGAISNFCIVSAVTDPSAPRTRRLSLFWVDLSQPGVTRRKLDKEVWVPSDLTRITLDEVFVPHAHLLGERGRGQAQVLEIFTQSRLIISALTLGTAAGAFELGLDHARKRKIFGKPVMDFQAKSFEIADHHARLEAARLAVYKACWARDRGLDDYKLDASVAKYLSVQAARTLSAWAADVFGAASVVTRHPAHRFPLDAWAASLGEGTQDVQKLIIFREIRRRLVES